MGEGRRFSSIYIHLLRGRGGRARAYIYASRAQSVNTHTHTHHMHKNTHIHMQTYEYVRTHLHTGYCTHATCNLRLFSHQSLLFVHCLKFLSPLVLLLHLILLKVLPSLPLYLLKHTAFLHTQHSTLSKDITCFETPCEYIEQGNTTQQHLKKTCIHAPSLLREAYKLGRPVHVRVSHIFQPLLNIELVKVFR